MSQSQSAPQSQSRYQYKYQSQSQSRYQYQRQSQLQIQIQSQSNVVIVLFNGYSKYLDDNRMDANCTCTLIKGEKNIIIDTMTAWDRERLLEALAKHDLQPSDIDYVVSTHSHADHIGNNNLFLNAEHIVGYSVQRGTIFTDKQIKEKDYQLCEGVTITATPGHTYEDVTVLVKSKTGIFTVTYAITGDLFEKKEDIAEPSLWINLGTQELRDSQALTRLKILKMVDYIVPGHGPMFGTNSSLISLMQNYVTTSLLSNCDK